MLSNCGPDKIFFWLQMWPLAHSLETPDFRPDRMKLGQCDIVGRMTDQGEVVQIHAVVISS